MKNYRIGSIVFLILCVTMWEPIYAATIKKIPTTYTELLLAVTFNQEDLNRIAIFLESSQGELLVDRDEIQLWHLRLPVAPPIFYQDHYFYPLSAFKGLVYEIDKIHMTIRIKVPIDILLETKITPNNANFTAPEISNLGGFVNYNANAQKAPGQSQISGILEGGYFNSYGVGTYSELMKVAGPTHKAIRLSTTWTRDLPNEMKSLRLGDTFTVPAMWGQAVGFGGIQWGTNFSTQPYFIPFPLPTLRGEATIPSTVNLYVNNTLISKNNIPSGPFSVTNIPTLTGQGNINLVVTDLLGRQQIINVPFYSSSNLLKAGLHNYAYEVGFIRNNFGIASNDYGRAVLAGTDDLGMTENFTREWSAELLRNQQTVGLGGNFLWNNKGVLSLAVAESHVSSGVGSLLLVGFQRQTLNAFSFGFNTQLTTSQFMRLGIQPGAFSPSMQTQVFASMPLNDASLGVSYTQQNNRGTMNASFLTLTYNKNITRAWALNVTTLTNVGGGSNKAIFLTLTHPMDERTSIAANGMGQVGGSQAAVNLQRTLPTDSGYGYNLYGSQGSQTNYQATLSAQNYAGNYSTIVSHQARQTGYQVNATGAVAMLGGNPYLSRQLTDSFGVVQVPGYSNVNVYLNNQVVAQTDRHGNALIPHLLAYNKNTIRINPRDLPLTAEINDDELDAVPYYRSGLVIRFPVHPAQDALLTVLLTSGKPLPTGALISMSGQTKEFPVAEGGVTYLSDLQAQNHLRASWGDEHCEFDVPYTTTESSLPNLGTFVCRQTG